MRRRLKTTKKSKKREAEKKKKAEQKVAVRQKKVEQKKPIRKKKVDNKKTDEKKETKKTSKKNLEVRVLGRPQKEKEEKNKVIELEIDREKEIEKKKEEARANDDYVPTKGKSSLVLQKQGTEEELNKHKMIIMWSGIIFFMIIIVFFWVHNTKKAIIESRIEQEQMAENKKGWDDLVDDVSDRINDMKSNLAEIEKFEQGRATSSGLGVPSDSFKNKIDILSEEEFNKINKEIEPELKDKIKFIY